MSRSLRTILQDFGFLAESPVILSGPRAFLTGGLLGAGPILVMRGLLLFGYGSWSSFGLPTLVAIFALPVALFASAFRALPLAKARATSVSMGALGLALGIVFAEIVGYRLRMSAFALATRRAQPIVVAIDRFEERYGRPPDQRAARRGPGAPAPYTWPADPSASKGDAGFRSESERLGSNGNGRRSDAKVRNAVMSRM